uniref:Pipecolic acid and sarcosine oxidase n=1 Tax=Phasianus colchicus TaxID=9054 RepID=A0A669PKI6_PHACC
MAAPGQPRCTSYDAIVIGAGIQGSFAAYHLAQRRRDTLLLEQFFLPHSRGSSHGQSRITRSAYPEQHYARMMPHSFHLWQQLEDEAGIPLYRRTGLVVLGPPGDPKLEGCRHSMGPDAVLDALTLAQRFPGLRPRPGEVALWDSSGGVLLANRALQAVQVGDDTGTEGWGHGGCSISTPPSLPPHTGRVSSDHCKGWWPQVAVWPRARLTCSPQPLRIDVCYWREKEPGSGGAVTPCFMATGLPYAPHGIYGLPALEYPGLVKNTPDGDFILDQHPKYSNIIIGAGFSGHGFKLAPVVGQLLCELSLGEEPSHCMAPFTISRFPGVLRAAL